MRKHPINSLRPRTVGALGIVYLVWGSTYLAIRYGVASIPPLLLAATRFVIAGACLLTWARIRRVPAATRADWGVALRLGAAFLFIANGGVTWAETRIPSGTTALIVATEPLWVAILSWAWARDARPGWLQIIALSVGFAGVASLVVVRPSSTADFWALVVLIASPMCWAFGSLYASRLPPPRAPVRTNGMMMVCGGGLLLAAGLMTGEANQLHLMAVHSASWLALLYLTVAGSLVAFSAYTYLLRVASPQLTSTYAFVNPLVAVVLGAVVAGELVTGRMVLGMLLIVGAVILLGSAHPSMGLTPRRTEASPPATRPVDGEPA